jgi:acyl dehydratase
MITIGDTIHADWTVTADRGNVVFEVKLTNGRGEAMHNGDRTLLVGREIVQARSRSR